MVAITGNVQDLFVSILENLSDKERHIVTRRIGLSGDRQTLQEIGDDFHITRERVRQIEDISIKKIGRMIQHHDLAAIQRYAKQVLELHGGLLVRDRLVNLIVQGMELDSSINAGILDVILASDFEIQKSKPQIRTRTYFYLPHISKKHVDTIFKLAIKVLKKRADIMERINLYELINCHLEEMRLPKMDLRLIDSVMDVFEEIVK